MLNVRFKDTERSLEHFFAIMNYSDRSNSSIYVQTEVGESLIVNARDDDHDIYYLILEKEETPIICYNLDDITKHFNYQKIKDMRIGEYLISGIDFIED